MRGNLRPILEQFVFDDEGEEFEVRASEPGGAVKLGVTFEALQRYWKLKKLGVPSLDHLAALTRDDAHEVYDLLYWQPMMGDALKVGVDYAVFDPVMNSGVTGGHNILEAALGAAQGTWSWPELVELANTMDAGKLIDRICDARLAHMRESPNWSKYEKGWTARVGRVRERSKKMAT